MTALRGGPARVERAAMADAAQQLARFFSLLQDGQRISIALDTNAMATQGTQAPLALAASGQHAAALEQLLAMVSDGASATPEMQFNIAVLYDILGVYDEALQWYGRALKPSPPRATGRPWPLAFNAVIRRTVCPKAGCKLKVDVHVA